MSKNYYTELNMILRQILKNLLFIILLSSFFLIVYSLGDMNLFLSISFGLALYFFIIYKFSYKIMTFLLNKSRINKSIPLDIKCRLQEVFSKLRIAFPKIYLMKPNSGFFELVGKSNQKFALYLDSRFFECFNQRDQESLIIWLYLTSKNEGIFSKTVAEISFYPLKTFSNKLSPFLYKWIIRQKFNLFFQFFRKGCSILKYDLLYKDNSMYIDRQVDQICRRKNSMDQVREFIRSHLRLSQKNMIFMNVYSKIAMKNKERIFPRNNNPESISLKYSES